MVFFLSNPHRTTHLSNLRDRLQKVTKEQLLLNLWSECPHYVTQDRPTYRATIWSEFMSEITKLTAVAFTALVVFFALVAPAPTHAYDGTFVFYACNTQKTSPGTSLYNAIVATIGNLEQQTPYYSYDYKNAESDSGVSAYGRGTCKYALSDCSACLTSVGKLILSVCDNAVGARYQVTDCFIQYESTAF